jgi:hypothetical protein
MARRKHNNCGAGTIDQLYPYLEMLTHYHLKHGGHASTYTGLTAAHDAQEWPDVYIVTDPSIRRQFKELTETIDAREDSGVMELERIHALSADDPARRKPRAPRKSSGV